MKHVSVIRIVHKNMNQKLMDQIEKQTKWHFSTGQHHWQEIRMDRTRLKNISKEEEILKMIMRSSTLMHKLAS